MSSQVVFKALYQSLFFVIIVQCCCFHAMAQPSIAGLPYTRIFSSVEYKGGIQNWSIAQDARGIMYVANNFGLLEYDGVQWQVLAVKNGTKVRSVGIGARGRIYVGCQGDFGFFFPNESGKLVYTSLADSLEAEFRNFDEAWSIYIDNETVYFCTFTRIYIYQDSKFTIVERAEPLDFSFLVNRALFVNVRNAGLCRLSSGKLDPLPGGEFFGHMSISGLLPLGNDQFLISTFKHGLYLLSNGKVRPWNEELQPYLTEAGINCMVRLRNGSFAAGTQNRGLLIFDEQGRITRELTRDRGLENRTVLGMYEDDQSNLWLGQNNGIALVELGSPFTFIDEQSGLPGTGYAALLKNSVLYLGTNTGLYARNLNSKDNFMQISNTAGQVYHVGEYVGHILAGHHQGALSINGKASMLSDEPGSWIFHSLKDHPDKLIEGTYAGLQLYETRNGALRLTKKLVGFEESARVMAEDEAGFLWVTHGYKGVFRIRFNQAGDSIIEVKHYGVQSGFPSDLLINVFRVRNELVFTSQAGVFKYDRKNDRFIRDKFYGSILGEQVQIWWMQEDAFGNIYLAGSEHLGVLKKNAIGQYTYEAQRFNRIRSFLNDDLVNITILQNNDVLFGAKDGFIHYDATQKNHSSQRHRTHIRRVAATGVSDTVLFFGNWRENDQIVDFQPETSMPELPYSLNSVSFSFSATGYEGNSNPEYQFYLEGFDGDWSNWTVQSQKEYTNLKEGKYIFHVRSRDDEGIVADSSSYVLTVLPPWYRSIVAYVIYSLLTIAILMLAFSLLDRKYQKEQKILEEKQQQELEKKENEIEKISTQSQEEINRLQHEKLEADLRHMNTELATATMHLLNKNEFITGIKNHLNHIIKKNGTEESRKELLQITRDIENNISADKDWEHFQFHFDRVHGDFTHRFKSAFPILSPQDIKLSAYLRMNLSTKEIAQLLNISVRGVEISRYRLRKKLQLDRNQNLQDYILNF